MQVEGAQRLRSSPDFAKTLARAEEPPTASSMPTTTDLPSAEATDALPEMGDKASEKYYKKFDFFYRRTAFRSMTEFYKGHFKPTLDKWREGERKSTKNFVLSYLWKKSEMDVKNSKNKGARSGRGSSEKVKDQRIKDEKRKVANFAKAQQSKNAAQGFQKSVDFIE